jgi:hypothetical protein
MAAGAQSPLPPGGWRLSLSTTHPTVIFFIIDHVKGEFTRIVLYSLRGVFSARTYSLFTALLLFKTESSYFCVGALISARNCGHCLSQSQAYSHHPPLGLVACTSYSHHPALGSVIHGESAGRSKPEAPSVNAIGVRVLNNETNNSLFIGVRHGLTRLAVKPRCTPLDATTIPHE